MTVYEQSRIDTLVIDKEEAAKQKQGGVDSVKIDGEGGFTATCNGKVIRARHVVLCGNAYSELLDTSSHYAPLHVYQLVTEPLEAEAREKVGRLLHAAGGLALYTLHHVLYHLRMTPDGRVCFGSGTVKYTWERELHQQSPEAYQTLLDTLLEWLPCLQQTPIAAHWEGVIALTLFDTPWIGRSVRHPNLLYSYAYCGHGVTLANSVGGIIATLVREGTKVDAELREKYGFICNETTHTFTPLQSVPVPSVEPIATFVALMWGGVLERVDKWEMWANHLANYDVTKVR